MLLMNWLLSLKHRFRSDLRSHRRPALRKTSWQPQPLSAQTETLEDRTLLAAFVVNTLNDVVGMDGLVSLREAITAANTNAAFNDAGAGDLDGDTITFHPSLAGGTINLVMGQLTISDDLSIDGGGNITISGSNNSRIFNIETATGAGSNLAVTLSNLSLEFGSVTGDGGALLITNSETVSLDSVTITNSTATNNGGAIFAGNGTLTITNSQIGNQLFDNDVWTNNGVSVSDKVFAYVDAQDSTMGDSVTLEVLNNSGTSLLAPFDPVAAGVEADETGNVFYDVGSFLDPVTPYEIYTSVVADTPLAENDATNGLFATADSITEDTLRAGSISAIDTDIYQITLGASDSVLVVMIDNDPEDMLNFAETSIEIIDTNQTTVRGMNLFPGGAADAAIAKGLTGGQVYYIRITSTNSADYEFVAKAVGSANFLPESEINNNIGVADLISASQFGQGNLGLVGGNRAVSGGGIFVNGGTLNVDFTSVNNNTATGVNGDLGGGGIYSLNGTVTIDNTSTVDFNAATGTNGSGGGVFANGGSLTIIGSSVSNNTARRAGGGLETRSNLMAVTATLTDANFTGNRVGSTPGNGGGLHTTAPSGVSPTTITITGGNFTGNSAQEEGGGIWNDVSSTITINGVNIDGNTASGLNNDQGGGGVFNNGGTLIIQNNMTTATSITGNIANGAAGSGGGILNDGGTLTITGAVISGNTAIRAGGGIEATTANARNSAITLTNVTLMNNRAIGGSTIARGDGGGVHISDATGGQTSTFTMIGGSASGNSAAQEGGGLWNDLGGTMTIRGTSITGNTASGSASDQGGGGVFNNGGTVTILNNITTATVISNNVANGSAGSGGGILNDGGTLTITGATIDMNSAARAGGGIEATTANSRASTVTLTRTNVTNNIAASNPGNGGGIHITDPAGGVVSTFTINRGTISGNSASQEGGGVWNAIGGTLNINGTLITGNTASGNSADQGGGGIFNDGGTVNIMNSAIATVISNNIANGSAGSGGGILNDGGTITIMGATITGNSATRAGGGFEATTVNSRNSTATVTGASITGNTAGINGGGVHVTDATGGNTSTFTITGGSVSGNSAAQEGGGLWNAVGGVMNINGVLIESNTASGDGADQGGGGIFNDGGTITIANGDSLTIISGNIADGSAGSGGGILNDGGTITMTGGTIGENAAIRAGGGIEVTTANMRDSVVTLNNVLISSNTVGTSPGNGGGVHISDATGGNTSTFTLTQSLVTGNSAAAEGGGLWNDIGGTLTITASTIQNNTASGSDADQGGGGIFNNGGTVVIQNEMTTGSTISGNVANGTNGSGGGILNDGGTLTINLSTITNNSARRAGGGIEATTANSRNSNITITNGTISTNTAGSSPGNGGGLHVSDAAGGSTSTVTIQNSMVNNNSAASEGGGLWNDAGGTLLIFGTTITANTASGALSTNGGGGIFNNGGNTAIFGETGAVPTEIIPTVISNNVANGDLGSGGGIFNDVGGTLSIVNTMITTNTANRAGGGIEDNAGLNTFLGNVNLNNNVANGLGSGPGNGGGLHITGAGTVRIVGGTVNGNSAASEGGGLWNSSTGTLIIGNSTDPQNALPNVITGSGANAAAIQTFVDNFRTNLGANNANETGTQGTGRREINWDGVPDGSSAPATFAGDFFNTPTSGRARGVEFTTPGTGFQVSANLASMVGVEFNNINSTYSADFAAFSAERLFTALGSNVTVVNFFVPGTDIPASVTGFGAVFTDVDTLGSTMLEFFDVNGNLITTQVVPAIAAGDETLSFAGVSFADPIIAQVRITSGNSALGPGINDGGSTDLVVMDDFIFGEPVPIVATNPVISNNIASGAATDNGGGGIFNDGGSLTVVNATVSANTANGLSGQGGGIFNETGGMANISQTTISGNRVSATTSAGGNGGGIFNRGTLEVEDSTISGNSTRNQGGGIWNSATTDLTQITVSGNTAGTMGGGVYTGTAGTLDILNSTITANRSTSAGAGLSNDGGSMVFLESTIIAGNLQGTAANDINGAVVGASQFNLIGVNTGLTGITNGSNNNQIGTSATPINPLLGPLANNGGPTQTHTLLAGSPAINAGSNPDNLIFDQRLDGFPRTIGTQIDIGALEVQRNITAVGRGAGSTQPTVVIFDSNTGEQLATVTPYPGFLGDIRTAVADVNADGVLDLITGAGPGGGSHVKVFSGADNFVTEIYSFLAFDPGFRNGIFVAAANFNPMVDDNADLVIAADAGGGPHVKVIDGSDGSTELQSFFAFPAGFTGGVRVATGDITGDGIPDIIAGAGAGGGPNVRVFNGASSQFTINPMDIGGTLGSFFAYDVSFTGGVYVASGDINGDGRDDIITGPGAGGGPDVRAFSGTNGAMLFSFFAYDANFTGGVRVGSVDGSNNDSIDDIVTGPGPGGGPDLRVFSGVGNTATLISSQFAFPATFTGGIFVSGGTTDVPTVTLLFGGGPIAEGEIAPLTQAQLDTIAAAAIDRLEQAGTSAADLAALASVEIQVGDLAQGVLGLSLPGRIVIDIDAAGAGWFIDPTPLDDAEYDANLTALDGVAFGRVDLLTVLLHELGHQLGAEDLDVLEHPENVMAESLTTGKRRLPNADLDQLFADGETLDAILS